MRHKANGLRTVMGTAVLYGSLLLLAVIAVPTGLLIGLMCLVWNCADRIVTVLER